MICLYKLTLHYLANDTWQISRPGGSSGGLPDTYLHRQLPPQVQVPDSFAPNDFHCPIKPRQSGSCQEVELRAELRRGRGGEQVAAHDQQHTRNRS